MRCSRAGYLQRFASASECASVTNDDVHIGFVSASECASVTNDDVHIAAVGSPDDDAADQAERNQATQPSKAAPAAEPDEAACAASSLPGNYSTPKGAGVSASLEWRIYNSKVKEERLEDALTAAKARLAELEIGAAKLREAAEWSKLADNLDSPKNLR